MCLVCTPQSIKTHVSQLFDTIRQTLATGTGSDLYDSRRFQPQFGQHQYLKMRESEAVSVLVSRRLPCFLLFDFHGGSLWNFVWGSFRRLFAPFSLCFFFVWENKWCQWCHASAKSKYKSNYVVCLATSFFMHSICILLQKTMRVALDQHRCVCFFPRSFCIQYVPAKFWRPMTLGLQTQGAGREQREKTFQHPS